MTRTRRIGVLTGGGDVPGLNSVIKSVVYRSTELGYEVIGIRRGWEGLTHMRPGPSLDPDYLRPLDRINTRTIDRTGGTWLHTSRTNPRKMRGSKLPPSLSAEEAARYATGDDAYDLTPLVLDHIASLGLDYLVAIGGDDTLSFAEVLSANGVAVIAIPKTMDNDVQGTEYCIGFSSAITRAKEMINRQRTTLGSHERIGVFRIFGRDAGFSALFTAYVTSGRCLIPEAPFDLRPAGRRHGRGPPPEPEPVRLRDRRRGGDVDGRLAGRVRRGGRLRAPPQGQRGRGAGRRAPAPGRGSRPSRAS